MLADFGGNQRTRGRPRSAIDPLFVEDCVRLDATVLLAKSRGSVVLDDGRTATVSLRWTEHGQMYEGAVRIPVTATEQPLGGVRRWWQCPLCQRRCRILLLTSDYARLGCRSCLGARYVRKYPGRQRDWVVWKAVERILTGQSGGSQSGDECSLLLAPRRRGVRRGRRVR